MTEWTGTPEASRLDELAAVTREYARFSRTAFGFALMAPGALVLLGVVVGMLSAPLSRVVLAAVPVLWLVLLPRARYFHQRHGRVVGPDVDMTGLAFDLLTPAALWCLAALGARALLGERATWAGTPVILGWLALLVCVAAFVATPLLARARLEGTTDRSLTVAFAAYAVLWSPREAWWPPFATAFALAFVARGVHEHLMFRRLERRLAALEGVRP